MERQIQIIYLNGPSSSGKTVFAKALQNALEEPFLHVGIDSIIEWMPEKCNNWVGGEAPLGFSWTKSQDETGNPIQELQMGPFAQKIHVDVTYDVVIDTHASTESENVEKIKSLALLPVKYQGSSVEQMNITLSKASKDGSIRFVSIRRLISILGSRVRGAGSARMQAFGTIHLPLSS